ncbi:PREDICTED: outer dense fiber protein 3-like [Eufriesea mexicana]|uniref:outer dense fiber protein 3-like n=1 Tax=Eufriesea mexicana TaxID=516756 RepID=UPI00083C1BEE|nr:PREDICTED: outer dense fiber protein 3-like [Eufriesea mexicana]
MPPKPDTQSKTEPDKYIGSPACNYRSPGPKYNLKTLVGFREHCISKHRNPAYTFGNRQPFLQLCEGPGPKYLIPEPKREGFSFGLIGKTFGPPCVPGPKYLLPTPKTPAFTIKSRTKPRDTCFTPGPYNMGKKQIRVIFLYEFKLSTKATETARKINDAFGPGTVHERIVRLWFKKFRSGDKGLKDQEGRGRPSAIDNDQLKGID